MSHSRRLEHRTSRSIGLRAHGILQAIKDSSDKIDKIELKLDAVTSSLDGLNDRADKTDEKT